MPSLRQRRKYAYIVDHGPNSAGKHVPRTPTAQLVEDAVEDVADRGIAGQAGADKGVELFRMPGDPLTQRTGPLTNAAPISHSKADRHNDSHADSADQGKSPG